MRGPFPAWNAANDSLNFIQSNLFALLIVCIFSSLLKVNGISSWSIIAFLEGPKCFMFTVPFTYIGQARQKCNLPIRGQPLSLHGRQILDPWLLNFFNDLWPIESKSFNRLQIFFCHFWWRIIHLRHTLWYCFCFFFHFYRVTEKHIVNNFS